MCLPFCIDPRLIQDHHRTTALRTSISQIATVMTSITAGTVSALIGLLLTLSTTVSPHHVPPRIKTVYQPCAFIPKRVQLILAAIFSNIAQACANKGSPITAVPAEATFSATSGGSLFASGWGSEYGSCASDGAPGFGRGKGHCNGWGGRCSWTTFTGSWGPGWLVSWSGFGGDGDCSATAGSSLSTATTPSSASATVTGGASPSLGATVITTVNGQTLTGTIFSAQGAAVSAATGTAGVVAQKNGGQASRNEKVGAFGAMVFALVATICML